MEGYESNVIHLELKYCERCGGLWLRPKGSDMVFCAACALSMAGMEAPVRVLPRHSLSDISESTFWTEGGNA